MNTDSKDDYLDEDPVIPSQRFALVSIVSPASVKTGPDFDWHSVTPSGEPWEFRLLKIRLSNFLLEPVLFFALEKHNHQSYFYIAVNNSYNMKLHDEYQEMPNDLFQFLN